MNANDPILALFNQAMQLQQKGQLSEARELYEKILILNPRHGHTLHMLGAIDFDMGRYEESEKFARAALAEIQDVPMFYYTLGNALIAQKKRDEGLKSYQQALAIKPEFVNCLNKIGDVYRQDGEDDIAFSYFARAAAIRPDAHAYAHMGFILQDKAQYKAAAEHYERALVLDPESSQILNNLGLVNDALGKYEDAIAYYKRALAIKPNNVEILSNFALTFKNLGRLDEAIACFKQALDIAPDHPQLYGNLLLTMVYAASVSPSELATTARIFGERIADPHLRQRSLIRDKNPERKLRIGYCSPDFCEHPVNYFFQPLIKFHDRDQFELFAYSNTMKEDATTGCLKRFFDHWRDIRNLNDDQAADLIEQDKLDILIDLAGHTGNNRLMVLARKPAPLQVTWLGYPATTGMRAIDYRITDHVIEPIGMTEHLNTETLWRLKGVFTCYNPHENSPAVTPRPPFETNGYITFGCFNNFAKVTDPVIKTWTKILEQVPNSRLLLEIPGLNDPKSAALITERLRSVGLPMERVILEPRKRSNQFVLYNRIDMALDPFPCAGGTTSMDTLWMGVPFVTLDGEHYVSRMGVSILTYAGLPELIAKNLEEYIRLAVDLAQDHERLRTMRHHLREKVMASPLMIQEPFVSDMEDAYRGMWRKYCASN